MTSQVPVARSKKARVHQWKSTSRRLVQDYLEKTVNAKGGRTIQRPLLSFRYPQFRSEHYAKLALSHTLSSLIQPHLPRHLPTCKRRDHGLHLRSQEAYPTTVLSMMPRDHLSI